LLLEKNEFNDDDSEQDDDDEPHIGMMPLINISIDPIMKYSKI